MKNKHDGKHMNMLTQSDETRWDEDYVWATSQESKRHALALSLIGSIVHKHGGTVQTDPETHSISIDVPNDEKLACAEELSRKVDMTLH
ncbi:MAG: hypothetical protein AMK69_08230 [Nitrospira bacterium SG8_3]|nr:MAG: hypothetical protein AMK69_08230 [Nitrospira bacterium SG8_3]